jgi:hypothetical protein
MLEVHTEHYRYGKYILPVGYRTKNIFFQKFTKMYDLFGMAGGTKPAALAAE